MSYVIFIEIISNKHLTHWSDDLMVNEAWSFLSVEIHREDADATQQQFSYIVRNGAIFWLIVE